MEGRCGEIARVTGHVRQGGGHWVRCSRRGERVALQVARELAPAKFPLADLDVLGEHFQHYVADPRNQAEEIVLSEAKIHLDLGPHPSDPTGLPIYIDGTLDQVRRIEDGTLIACDIKTGSRLYGGDMLHEHCAQLVCYQLAASQLLGEHVRGARIIRTADYPKGQVHHDAWWRYRDLAGLIAGIPIVVSLVRQGITWETPGEWCRWCPLGGHAYCSQILSDFRSSRP